MTRNLFHITNRSQLRDAKSAGWYEPVGFKTQGYIHCSFHNQITSVANRLFAGQCGLVILEIDPNQLNTDIVQENLEGGDEMFPHIYGRLPWRAVVHLYDFRCSPDGKFLLPVAVRA